MEACARCCEPIRLYDTLYTRHTDKRIGEDPACNTCQGARDAELEKCGGGPLMKKEAEANEHRWMNDVHGIGTAIEPRPEFRGCVHAGVEEQHP